MVHYNLSFCNDTFYALTIGQNYYICAMSTNPVSTYNFLIWKDINYTYADPIKKIVFVVLHYRNKYKISLDY